MKPTHQRKAIGLTPLIDIVFILLMFFMLTSSFTHERQLTISSPTISSTKTEEQPLRLWILEDGRLINRHAKHIDEDMLAQIDSSQTFIIHPEAAATAQIIVSTFVRLKASGFLNVSLGGSYSKTEILGDL